MRLCLLIALFWVLIAGFYAFIIYWVVWVILLEKLNAQDWYKSKFIKLNRVFLGFVYFILTVRLINWPWSTTLREIVNIAEHLLFSILVCVMLFLASYFSKKNYTIKSRLLVAFFIVNAVGVINEIYQIYLSGRPIQSFNIDNLKDISVNFLGAFIACIFIRGIGKRQYAILRKF